MNETHGNKSENCMNSVKNKVDGVIIGPANYGISATLKSATLNDEMLKFLSEKRSKLSIVDPVESIFSKRR